MNSGEEELEKGLKEVEQYLTERELKNWNIFECRSTFMKNAEANYYCYMILISLRKMCDDKSSDIPEELCSLVRQLLDGQDEHQSITSEQIEALKAEEQEKDRLLNEVLYQGKRTKEHLKFLINYIKNKHEGNNQNDFKHALKVFRSWPEQPVSKFGMYDLTLGSYNIDDKTPFIPGIDLEIKSESERSPYIELTNLDVNSETFTQYVKEIEDALMDYGHYPNQKNRYKDELERIKLYKTLANVIKHESSFSSIFGSETENVMKEKRNVIISSKDIEKVHFADRIFTSGSLTGDEEVLLHAILARYGIETSIVWVYEKKELIVNNKLYKSIFVVDVVVRDKEGPVIDLGSREWLVSYDQFRYESMANGLRDLLEDQYYVPTINPQDN